MDGCLDGNKKAQRALYERFGPRMLGVCYRYADSRQEAEDFLQDGFITVFQKMKTLKDPQALEAWVKRIMISTALQYLRKKKRLFKEVNLDTVNSDTVAETFTTDSPCPTEAVMAAIQELPTGYRTVLNLFAIEGYSHKEIAAMLDITEATSRTQYFKAKAKITHILKTKHVGEENTPYSRIG